MTLPFFTTADVQAAAPVVSRHLLGGGLLAYPTETVYGLGSEPGEQGLDALARLKGRPPRKPFLLLVSGLAMLEQTGLAMTPAARVLAREFWPGPLTLVLRGGEGRLPARSRPRRGTLCAGLACVAGGTTSSRVTISPRREPDRDTPHRARGLCRALSRGVQCGLLLVLDGGVRGKFRRRRCRCHPSVPVWCARANPREELRARVGSRAPDRCGSRRLIGQTLPPPSPARLADRRRRALAGRLAGSPLTSAWSGAPVSDGSLLVALERGIDLSRHRARLLTAEDIRQADLILTMGESHAQRVAELGGGAKVHLFRAFADGDVRAADVPDPFGRDVGAYRATADLLDGLIARIVPRLVDRATPAGQP